MCLHWFGFLLVLIGIIHASQQSVLQCMECHEVVSPQDCNISVTCGQGEECLTRQFLNANGQLAYHMGCQDTRTCDIYAHTDELVKILLGKRDVSDLDPSASRMCAQCCNSSDCNTNLCRAKPTTPPTTTYNCPSTYFSYHNKCYFCSTSVKNWEDAAAMCYQMNTQLVSINSLQEQHFLANILNNISDASGPDGFWTGGFYNANLKTFQWPDGTWDHLKYWGPLQPRLHHDSNHYKVELKNPQAHSPYTGWTWSYDDHLDKLGYICEMTLK